MGRQLRVDDIIINDQILVRPVHPTCHDKELQTLQRLVQRFSSPSSELINETVAAVRELTQADSAGITLMKTLHDGSEGLRWVSTAGPITKLGLQALPRAFSPCGVVLDRQAPQLMSYPGRFFTYIEDSWQIVEVLLVPWRIGDKIRGTIWAVLHSDDKVFDREDLRVLQNLVVFASTAVSRNEQEAARLAREASATAAKVAHQLAHAMNNPLQALTNSLYLVDEGCPEHLDEARRQLDRLTRIVRAILALNAGPISESDSDALFSDSALLPLWAPSPHPVLKINQTLDSWGYPVDPAQPTQYTL